MAKGTAKPGKGGARPGRANPLAQAAHAQVAAAEQPIEAQIQQERAANLARAQQQMGMATAAAAIMKAAAPGVQTAYTNAANADAGYARGLGNVAQQAVTQNTNANNQFLSQTGAPSSALQAPSPVGDIGYGYGGFVPASSIQKEGAGWEAQAQLAPGNVLNLGQDNAAATLLNDPAQVSLQNDLAKVAATEPAVYQKLVSMAQTQQYHQSELGLRAQTLQSENAYRRASLQALDAYRQASLGMQQERITLASRKQTASLRSAILKGERPDPSLSKVYGYVVDTNGNPVLDNRGKKIPVKSTKSSSSAGLPPPPSGVAPWKTTPLFPSFPGVSQGGGGLAEPGGGKPSTNAGGFLPKGAKFTYDRHDQGRDIQTAPYSPILAPGSGYVVRIASDPGGGGGHFGPHYPIVHFTSGPYAGQDMYIGHTVAAVRPGQKFRAGAVLSHTQESGPMNGGAPSGWAEIGFAPGGTPGAVGQPAPF